MLGACCLLGFNSQAEVSPKRRAAKSHAIESGALYSADTLPLGLFAERMPFTRPLALQLSAALAPALMMVTCYLPSDVSDMTLRLSIQSEKKAIVVNGTTPDTTRNMLLDTGSKLQRAMRRLGTYSIPSSLTISPPGSDAHIAGTVPMGGKGQLSCTAQCELASAPGVFVIDGSWFPRLPAKHCTFTIMANAYRVGAIIAEQAAAITSAIV